MQGMNVLTGKPLSGVDHLKQSIANILKTPIGSRVMRRDYGSNLFNRIDDPITGDLIAEIYADVYDALDKWEPRFKLQQVSFVDANKGQLSLKLVGLYSPTGQFDNQCKVITINEVDIG